MAIQIIDAAPRAAGRMMSERIGARRERLPLIRIETRGRPLEEISR